MVKGLKKGKGDAAAAPIVAIDIGTYMIRIAEGIVQDDGNIDLLYYNECPSAGMVGGAVGDLSALAEAISSLVQSYSESTGKDLHNCFIGIAGRHILSLNSHGTSTVLGEIEQGDVLKAIESACSVRLETGYILLHAIPQNYIVEGIDDIVDPVGLSAMRLDANVHLIGCSDVQKRNLETAIKRVNPGIKITSVIYDGLAAAEAVLTEAEKEIGVCVIDFGHGAISVTIYDRKRLVISFGIDRGGALITRHIAVTFGVDTQLAESMKVQSAACLEALEYMQLSQKTFCFETIDNITGLTQERQIRLDEVCACVCDMLQDTFKFIADRIEEYVRTQSDVYTLNLGAGFVLTGGMAMLPGVAEVASRHLSPSGAAVKVRCARPRGVRMAGGEGQEQNLQEQSEADLRLSYEAGGYNFKPDQAVCLGLLRYAGLGWLEQEDLKNAKNKKKGSRGALVSIIEWIKQEVF